MLDARKVLKTLALACRQGGDERAYCVLTSAWAYLLLGEEHHRFLSQSTAKRCFWGRI